MAPERQPPRHPAVPCSEVEDAKRPRGGVFVMRKNACLEIAPALAAHAPLGGEASGEVDPGQGVIPAGVVGAAAFGGADCAIFAEELLAGFVGPAFGRHVLHAGAHDCTSGGEQGGSGRRVALTRGFRAGQRPAPHGICAGRRVTVLRVMLLPRRPSRAGPRGLLRRLPLSALSAAHRQTGSSGANGGREWRYPGPWNLPIRRFAPACRRARRDTVCPRSDTTRW